MPTDDIDQLLSAGDPASELTVRERQLTAEMVARSQPGRARSGYARPLAIGALAALLLGGGGVAVAAGNANWMGWAENDALGVVFYELPSGATCEWRIGNVMGAPDEVDEIIRQTLADVDLSEAEIASAAARVGEEGDPMTDDSTHEIGVMWAVNTRIEIALETEGLAGLWTSMNGQGFCE